MALEDVLTTVDDAVLTASPISQSSAVTNLDVLSAAPVSNALSSPKLPEPAVIADGAAAAAQVADLLPNAVEETLSSSLGYVRLAPGMVLAPDTMIVTVDSYSVRYMVGDTLYRYGTSNFLRAYFLTAAAEAGARAATWVEVSNIEISLITGLLVPWQALLGAKVAQVAILAYHHRDQVQAAWNAGYKAVPELITLAEKDPQLTKQLLLTTGKDILANIPGSVEITAADVAFFLGRCIHGLAEEAVGSVASVSGTAALKVISGVVVKIAALHLAEATPEAIAKTAQAAAADLQKQFAAYGVTLSADDAVNMLTEVLSDPDSRANLQALSQNLNQLLPAMSVLAGEARNWRVH